jgi:hypothetical protein
MDKIELPLISSFLLGPFEYNEKDDLNTFINTLKERSLNL